MNLLAPVHSANESLVPEDRVLTMITAAAEQLERAQSIPDVLQFCTQADALEAVTKKIHASERAKNAAVMLRIEAERQLGRLTKEIPEGRRGGAAIAGQPTKTKTIAKQGVYKFRMQIAEKLADTPREAIEDALLRSKSKTLTGVAQVLGFRKPYSLYPRVSPMQKIAFDALGLLITCQSEQRAPRAEEVDPLREAFKRHDA